jgi:hypothetical protein
MPREPRPSPPRRSILAYAFYAAAIWALVAYSLWGPKPPSARPAVLASNCPR